MSEQAKICRERAADCERRMLLPADKSVQKTYRELASQWRDMADQDMADQDMADQDMADQDMADQDMADQAEELEKRQSPGPDHVHRSGGGA